MSGKTKTTPDVSGFVKRSVSFISKNASDPVVWSGMITGCPICSEGLPGSFDATSYNAAVRLSDSTVSDDITQLTFFSMRLDSTANPNEIVYFAQEWIRPGSFKSTDLSTIINADIYLSHTDKLSDMLAVLANAGYKVKVKGTTTLS